MVGLAKERGRNGSWKMHVGLGPTSSRCRAIRQRIQGSRRAIKKAVGLRVTGELLRRGVPVQGPLETVGNADHVRPGHCVDSQFDIAEGAFPGLHGFDEVAVDAPGALVDGHWFGLTCAAIATDLNRAAALPRESLGGVHWVGCGRCPRRLDR